MHIRELDIRGFGRLNDFNMRLSEGLNIIYGNNEAGKSTVQAFIKGVFYALKGGRTGKDGSLPPAKRFKPWNCNDFSGFIEYELCSGEVFKAERSFANNSVRIYDSTFNNITQSFEAARDKGALFAEKHLGINEVCFEKTVFIKQMETRISEDASKELHSRLSNVRDTGFEDISGKKAQEALKEALISYVGTDKTSTRPLDKVTARLGELAEIKKELVLKRDSVLVLQGELNDLLEDKARVEGELLVLKRAKEYAQVTEEIREHKNNEADLSELLKETEGCEEELKSLKEQAKELSAARDQAACFSQFSDEDIDDINKEFHELQGCLAEINRLDRELARKRGEFSELESLIAPMKALGNVRADAEEYIVSIRKNLDSLRNDYEKANLGALSERINTVRTGIKHMKYALAAAAVLSTVLFTAGFAAFPEGVFWGTGAAAAAVVMVCMILQRNKMLFELQNQKSAAHVFAEGIKEQINSNEKELERILKDAGVQSIEEFVKVKILYDSRVKTLAPINNDLNLLEGMRLSNMHKAGIFKNAVFERLLAAGIVDITQAYASSVGGQLPEIRDEHIRSFVTGVKRYKELAPNMAYTLKRLQDIDNSLKGLYRKASSIYGQDISDRASGVRVLNAAHEYILRIEQRLAACADGLKAACESIGAREDYFDSFRSKSRNELDEEYSKTNTELGMILLKIRECETLIKNSTDDERLQSIEEEIIELENRKAGLEEINLSLKTALDVLNEASLEIRREFAPSLNSIMSAAISKLTGGRYNDLRADDSLGLKVSAPETGDVVASSLLSSGTVDQLYLALRISMAQLITAGGERLPLIMDEIFSQYDDARTRLAFEYLKELSKERQIILFTCKKRELEIAGEVCEGGMNIIELM